MKTIYPTNGAPMERKIPKAVKRRRHLVRLIREAQTRGAANHYLELVAPSIVGYDPSREFGSPRAG